MKDITVPGHLTKESENRKIMKDIQKAFKPISFADGIYLKWLDPYILTLSITEDPAFLYISFYRCFSESALTSLYPSKLRKLNAFGTDDPFSVLLSKPEAVYKYGTRLSLEFLSHPLKLCDLVAEAQRKAELGFRKIIEV